MSIFFRGGGKERENHVRGSGMNNGQEEKKKKKEGTIVENKFDGRSSEGEKKQNSMGGKREDVSEIAHFSTHREKKEGEGGNFLQI